MELLRGFLAVGTGAALGAWLRWGLAVWLNSGRQTVALGTLAANLAGGYLVGLALAWIMSRPGLAPEWRLFLITGLMGGLTTFSTFSAEVVLQLERQQYGAALLGVAMHLFGSLGMTVLGLYTWRWLQPG